MHFDYDLERVKVGAQRDVAVDDDDDDDDDDESFSIVINQIGAAAILYTTPPSRINDGRTDGRRMRAWNIGQQHSEGTLFLISVEIAECHSNRSL